MAPAKTARRSLSLSIAALAVLSASACGGDGEPATFGGPVDTASSSPGAKATASAPAKLKEITSACELLPANQVVKTLGGSDQTTLKATEAPPAEDETTRYTCTYQDGNREALSLVATAFPDRADTATETIDAIGEGSEAKTTRVDGVGADAVAYTVEGARVLAFAVPYQQELRLVVLSGPSVIPQSKFAALGKQVAARL
ncbi:hypothetical protein GCM10022225_47750 [Plantactinospora mayteni]|uniref:DUF3558 domain-containing protein n=1 Tax=Plantactinospora mayteni TaxID=566021 RepID=A0ABQ4ESW9_9ACTN|nr:hypothetical protein [Plantactinospora mayteni]GIG97714.1 hypothetical protein Pma05_42870 [Plantactinospora mayteni]